MKNFIVITSLVALTINFVMLPIYLLTGAYLLSIVNVFSSYLLYSTLNDLFFNKDKKDPLVDDECQ